MNKLLNLSEPVPSFKRKKKGIKLVDNKAIQGYQEDHSVIWEAVLTEA